MKREQSTQNMMNARSLPIKTLLTVLFSFLIFSFFFSSCPSPLTPPSSAEMPQGFGSFSLALDANTGRTILPTSPTLAEFVVYTLVFTPASGGASTSVDRDNAALSNPVILAADTYNLTVSAYKDAGKTKLAARGTLTGIVISPGASISRSLTLNLIRSSTGTGTFSWNITVSAPDVTAATMAIKQNNAEVGTPVTLNASGVTTGSRGLPSGVYNIRFTLTKGALNEEAVWDELLYVYDEVTSAINIDFNNDYFYTTHYTVTLVYNYAGAPANGTQSVMHGGNLPSSSDPARTGYSFEGWHTDAACTAAYAPAPVYGNLTLYAKWNINQYTVTFNKNGGDTEASPQSRTVNHGSTVAAPTPPTRADYNFIGWYKEAALTNQWDFAADTVTGNITLYAKWELLNSPEKPFLVNNETELRYVGRGTANPEGYKDWTLDKHYRQTANITLTQGNWTMISGGFTGSYNGGGHTITGLTITGISYSGMFSTIGINGKVENLGLINVNITSNTTGGGIAGDNDGTIQNCYVTGTVTGAYYVGGIAGDNSGTIQNCYVSGNVTATGIGGEYEGINRNGGIAGNNDLNGTIRNCVALNQSVTNGMSPATVGRVTGRATYGTRQNNYAWSGMALKVAGSPVTPTPGLTTIDGADITAAQAKTQSTWETAGFTFDADSPWVWNSANSRPVLRNEVPQPWPGYLVDGPATPGTGTQDDPFIVWNEQTLRYVGRGTANPPGYTNWTVSVHYLQTANITLSSTNWTPIGSDTYDDHFSGSYNGGGHTITGLTIDASTGYQGMFAFIGDGSRNGTVKNLGLINVNITTTGDRNGGIAGASNGTIQNCYVTGSVTGRYYIGGIAGMNNGGTIQNCYVRNAGGDVGIKGEEDVGGIVGGSLNPGAVIQNCYVTGKVTNTGDNTGGIAGYNDRYIINCVAMNSTVEARFSACGKVTSDTSGTLQNNYARPFSIYVNGTTTIGGPASLKDGTSVSDANLKTETWWKDANTWSSVLIGAWDFDNVWQWNTNGPPSLRGVDTDGTVPFWPF